MMDDRLEVMFSYRCQTHGASARTYGFVEDFPPLRLVSADGVETMEDYFTVRGPGGVLYAVDRQDLEVIER